MGMAASQARFLGLTARKTNVEYQGQQVNQQRASLANESAGLFNQMTALRVPLPPSATNFYSSRYVFESSDSNQFSLVAINPSAVGNSGEYEVKLQYKIQEQVAYVDENLYPTFPNGKDGNSMMVGTTTYTKRNEINPNETAFVAIAEKLTAESKGEKTYTKDDFVSYSNSDTGKTYYVLKTDLNQYDPQAQGSRLPLHFANLKTVTKNATGTASFDYDATNTERYSRVNLSKVEPAEAALSLGISEGVVKGFPLEIRNVQDDPAYEEATKDYEFQKMLYERSIQDINAKTEAIQQQDKSLELKLKQLDTEQKALQTEMEAVQKVIQKNVETTFKTFG